MTRTAVLLMSVFLLLSAGAEDKSRLCRRPACGGLSVDQACPLNYSPVCGNDGISYVNECALCVEIMHTNADILIVKEGCC
ncbi:probable pancreatic secretory proteinase inhibitor [Xyrauchen texanus]|uniref:probable pancreatic secretory proteinase inhibitor n=1 Tax=Xyrauchen texanus TaxID=154827 RepID=UPI00224243AF|nr:probable pancreatic secretory proteinase inhibitor [Xyrauchen texanus]